MIMEVGALKRFDAGQSQRPGFKGTEPGSDDDRAGMETGTRFCSKLKSTVRLYDQFDDPLTQVVGGVKWLELFREPIDQFLGTDDRQGRNVVDCLVRVEHGTLATNYGQ